MCRSGTWVSARYGRSQIVCLHTTIRTHKLYFEPFCFPFPSSYPPLFFASIPLAPSRVSYFILISASPRTCPQRKEVQLSEGRLHRRGLPGDSEVSFLHQMRHLQPVSKIEMWLVHVLSWCGAVRCGLHAGTPILFFFCALVSLHPFERVGVRYKYSHVSAYTESFFFDSFDRGVYSICSVRACVGAKAVCSKQGCQALAWASR